MRLLFVLLMIVTSYGSFAQLDPEQIVREQEEKKKEEDKKGTVFSELPRDAKGNIVYTDVVKTDSLTAQELFSKAKIFVAESFRSAKSVTDLTDDASKTIIVKAITQTKVKGFGLVGHPYCRFQLKIECKDNRYRYTIDDIAFVGDGMEGPFPFEKKKPALLSKNQWIDCQQSCHKEITTLISLLKQNMTSKPKDDF